MDIKRFLILVVLLVLVSCQEENNDFAYTDGKDIFSAHGELLHLRGVNLGNWLLPEGYMFKLSDCNSPRKIDQAIRELVGNTATTEFWDSFLDNYITEADISWLEKAGVNIIRLPFDYRLLTHDDYLGRGQGD